MLGQVFQFNAKLCFNKKINGRQYWGFKFGFGCSKTEIKVQYVSKSMPDNLLYIMQDNSANLCRHQFSIKILIFPFQFTNEIWNMQIPFLFPLISYN